LLRGFGCGEGANEKAAGGLFSAGHRRIIVPLGLIGSSVVNRSRIGMLAAVAFVGAAAAANAGPCTTQISQVERQIRQAQAASPPGGAGEPSAPQSVGAQLHHQPTPGSVQNAEHAANADGEAALARARKADAEGNASACAKALTEARALYGIE
jgi:hypothetical protein